MIPGPTAHRDIRAVGGIRCHGPHAVLSTVHQHTLHVLSTIPSPSTLCGARCTACCPWVRTRRMLCVHIPPTCAQHDTISIHVVRCPWCGDVLCMLTHCPCCAAHTTTYACTCTIMLQRPSPMVGAVVLLWDTTLHAQLLYVHAACSVYTPPTCAQHDTISNSPCSCSW